MGNGEQKRVGGGEQGGWVGGRNGQGDEGYEKGKISEKKIMKNFGHQPKERMIDVGEGGKF